MTLCIATVSGAAVATVDSEDFPSSWVGVWWAVVTMTTVGYGDIAPKHVAGGIIGIFVMVIGAPARASRAPVVTLAQRFRAVPSGSDLAWLRVLRVAMRGLAGFPS